METNLHNLDSTLVCLEKLVRRLNADNILSSGVLDILKETLDQILRDSLDEFHKEYSFPDSVFSKDGTDFCNNSEWQFIDLVCSVLMHLCDKLEHEDLSLSNQKVVKESVLWVVVLGIAPNLIKGVGIPVKDVANFTHSTDDLSSLQKYRRLCAVTKVLLRCLQNIALRSVISHYLGAILTALCQLSYAPLKKPSPESSKDLMSQDLYEMFCKDQIYYQTTLQEVINSVYQPRVIQELMLIQGSQQNKAQPLWLRKCCSKLLTQILLSKGGVSNIVRSTMESSVDTGTDWKTVNILTKIITSPQYHYSNICTQLCEILLNSNASTSCIAVSIACVNELMLTNPELVQKVVIEELLKPVTCLSSIQLDNSAQSDNLIVAEDKFTLCIKHLHQFFAVRSSSSSSSFLPSYLLHGVSHILFQLYGNIHESVSHLAALVANLLFCILNDCSSVTLKKIVNTVIFKEHSDSILSLGNISFVLGQNGGVQVVKAQAVERGVEFSAVEEAGNVLMFLLDKKDADGSLSYKVFAILLQILSDFGISPKNLDTCDNLLGTVEDAICELVTRSERHVGAVRLLAALAEIPNVQKQLSQKPDCVVDFLETLLQREVHHATSFKSNYSEEADILCVALMILEVIISRNKTEVNWDSFKTLIPLLEKLKTVCVNPELENLASHIYNTLITKGVVKNDLPNEQNSSEPSSVEKSECDQAFEDACDPLLPTRGHAIVKLTKLINSRDKQTIAKKDAILCLFQENLKNDDSFIYLAAINGMAALSNYFPDTVISILTEEFSVAVSETKSVSEEGNLIRIKIGEVLVKVTRSLGEMASKYKNQLLNAFLVGVKDVDPLVRASSLSNLGEACRVLGFRVGPILQELLLCITNVISSDKAAEPRRAAVMVITLLLQGLEKDALQVLSDNILELYRALKNLYERETDHATKLHAQLALEEVDNIARTFLFAESSLLKKISML